LLGVALLVTTTAAANAPLENIPVRTMLELYLPMFIMFAIALGLCAVMFCAGHFLGPKNPTPDKVMPFECGNDTEGSGHTKMSVKFYLTAILFVVFDIEVVFMYPWATLFKGLGWTGFVTMLAFIGSLLIAMVYCWKKGALEWES
jgi:NADH-quinone oxidoreductase subunit A